MVPPDILKDYDDSRDTGADLSVLCHAPFLSLNFDQSGRVTACCFNREYILGIYPEQSVREIWQGEAAAALRRAFREGAVVPGCDRCFHQLGARNFSGALMRNFDVFSKRGSGRSADVEGPPLVLEFELSNTCSLECVMCGGHWSSAIRANREKLPPLRNPYDKAFVEQIEEFLPSVRAVRFLGGEPFLITRYHELWESIRRLNPDLEVSITTSGAVVPARPRQAVEGIKASFIISLDGMTKATYERIRQNAVFEEVMANITDLYDYTKRRGTGMTLACCPMTHNWHELAAIVDFAQARGLGVFFNTVTYPIESSLAGLSASRLASIIDTLEAQGRAASWSQKNRAQWTSLLSQLRAWLRDKQVFISQASDEARQVMARVGLARAPGDLAEPVPPGVLESLRRLFRRRSEAPRALPDPSGLEPVIPALVLARSVERAKDGQAAPQTDLLCRLPALPLEFWPAATRPSPLALMLGVLAVAAAEEPSVPDAVRRPIGDQLDRVSHLVTANLTHPTISEQISNVGRWIEQRVVMAQWRVVARGVRDLVTALESGEPLEARPAQLRERVLDGIADVYPNDNADRALAMRLAAVLLAHRGPIDFSGDPEPTCADAWLVPAMFPAALQTIGVFQTALHKCPDERLARRVAAVRHVIERPEAARALDKVSFLQVFDIMCGADDAAFNAAIQYVQASAGASAGLPVSAP